MANWYNTRSTKFWAVKNEPQRSQRAPRFSQRQSHAARPAALGSSLARIFHEGNGNCGEHRAAAKPFSGERDTLDPRGNRRHPLKGNQRRSVRERLHEISGLGEILDLRNRVAHHEPLIERDLSKEHTNIIEFMRWISPEKAEWVRAHSFLQATFRQRPLIQTETLPNSYPRRSRPSEQACKA